MPFIAVPNGIQLCFLFTTSSQKWQFCLTLQKSAGAVEDTDLQQATADGHSWWTSFLRGALAAANTLTEIVATDLTSQGAPQYRDLVNEAGNNAGGFTPANVAIVASHRTAKRGRSYRGRSYVGGIPVTQVDTPTTLAGSTATAFANGFASLRGTLDTHNLDHVVATKQHNGAVVSPAEVNSVISTVVDTLLDSQRRRLAGRGT